MTFEKALAELVYDNGERDWDNCMFDMAGGVYERCKEALEKQIPKRWTIDMKCPNCGHSVYNDSYKFCMNCGQRIDWSEVDE